MCVRYETAHESIEGKTDNDMARSCSQRVRAMAAKQTYACTVPTEHNSLWSNTHPQPSNFNLTSPWSDGPSLFCAPWASTSALCLPTPASDHTRFRTSPYLLQQQKPYHRKSRSRARGPNGGVGRQRADGVAVLAEGPGPVFHAAFDACRPFPNETRTSAPARLGAVGEGKSAVIVAKKGRQRAGMRRGEKI